MANYAMFVIICASKIKLIKVKLNPICAEKIVSVHLCARWERGRWVGSSTSLVPRPCPIFGAGTGDEASHPQGDMHMMAARLGCESAMARTGWANSCPGCMDRLRKHYSGTSL